MPDGKRAAVRQRKGTGAAVVRMGMKKIFLFILICFFICYPSSVFAKKQIQSLTFTTIEDILPFFPLLYKTWKVEKSTESVKNDVKSVSYLLSDTVGIVATGSIKGEITSIVVFVTYDKKREKHEAALNFIEDSIKAVNVIGLMAIKNFTNEKNSELNDKLIEHLSLKNSDVVKGKTVDAPIKNQGVKLEATFIKGTYLVTADAVD